MIDKIKFLIDEIIIKINLKLNIINLLVWLINYYYVNWWNYKNINHF